MINHVSTVSIFVNDQDEALAFYTEKLGFELRIEAPMGSTRWIAVAPKGGQTEVILYKMDENWQHYKQVLGNSQAVTFDVSNIDQLYTDLAAKGVEIVSEPDKQPWGTFMTILDQDKNALLLVEHPEK
jgi:uncharacterized glyoxalase superfamily protein PhnB